MSISRRDWLLNTGLGATAISCVGAVCSQINRPGAAAETLKIKSPEVAIARLREGNARFVSGNPLNAHRAADWRSHLIDKQEPFATILGCSDSRVPPELVFDQGFGDLFVIRVAGNVVSSDVLGSLQYAILHLKTPLVVVLGHEKCGAVTAAVEHLAAGVREPSRIEELVSTIEPGLKSLEFDLPAESRLSKAVALNVVWSLDQLARLPERTIGPKIDHPALVAAVYDLATGKVTFLDGA